MDSWTYQTGFPLITLRAARNASLLVADQQQFFYLQPAAPNPSRWKVPLFVAGNSRRKETPSTVWLLEKGTGLHAACRRQ